MKNKKKCIFDVNSISPMLNAYNRILKLFNFSASDSFRVDMCVVNPARIWHVCYIQIIQKKSQWYNNMIRGEFPRILMTFIIRINL